MVEETYCKNIFQQKRNKRAVDGKYRMAKRAIRHETFSSQPIPAVPRVHSRTLTVPKLTVITLDNQNKPHPMFQRLLKRNQNHQLKT
jgi:hypothetical protein